MPNCLKKNKYLLLLIPYHNLCFPQKELFGKILDENKNPIFAANVYVKGNIDGGFWL